MLDGQAPNTNSLTWQFIKSVEDPESSLVHLNELIRIQDMDLVSEKRKN